MHVCDIFNVEKVSELRFNAGVCRVPDSVRFDQVQIIDVSELGRAIDYRSTIRGSVNPLTLNPNANLDPRIIGTLPCHQHLIVIRMFSYCLLQRTACESSFG